MDHPIHAVWSSPDGPTLVGSGVAATVTGGVAERFATLREAGEGVFDRVNADGVPEAARPRLLGGFSFHDRHAAEGPWEDFPPAWFVLPEVLVTLTGEEGWITVTADVETESTDELLARARRLRTSIRDAGPVLEPPGIDAIERTTTFDEWMDQVNGATAAIESNDIEKVTLAQTIEATLENPFPLAGTLERMGSAYPSCYRFGMRPGASSVDPTPTGQEPPAISTFFGASPERLVSKRGSTLRTEALASTVGRGETDAEDERLASQLTSDEKYRHEHDIVVESITDQLESVASDIRSGPRSIRRLESVQHLLTPIEAHSETRHVLDVVEALHPTPAVGGLPPAEALETIRSTEKFDRGWYAAPVGWFDASGDGTFAVGIRSAVASDAKATLFAGNGIVADSDPTAEWDEVQLKYRPVLDRLR
ncbi:MAG: isochorismate synthase MenF [Halanaeroarchaeum sp.]